MPDRFAFTLAPNETAKLSFGFSAAWENKLDIVNSIDNTTTEKGNTHGRNQTSMIILNDEPQDQDITIIASYKSSDNDHFRPSSGICHKDKTEGGTRHIVYGFEDQNHGVFKNALIYIKVF